MNILPLPQSRRPASTTIAALVILLGFGALQAAQAAVSGGIDPQTGLSNLLSWGMLLAQIICSLLILFIGFRAFQGGHAIGGVLVGILAGLAIVFGGPYIMQHYGAGGGIGI